MKYDNWKGLDKAFNQLERELVEVSRGIAVELFTGLLDRSPQDSGGLVMSYYFSVGRKEYRNYAPMAGSVQDALYDSDPDQAETMRGFRRAASAIEFAKVENRGNEMSFVSLGQPVWITNGADDDEGPYAANFEKGGQRVRAVNRPGEPIGRTLAYIARRYGKNVGAQSAERLKKTRI